MFTGSRSNLIATGLILLGLVLFLLIYGRGRPCRRRGRRRRHGALVIPSLSRERHPPDQEEAVTKFDIRLLLRSANSSRIGRRPEAVLVEASTRSAGALASASGPERRSRLLTLDSYTGVTTSTTGGSTLVNLGIPGFVMFLGMYITLLPTPGAHRPHGQGPRSSSGSLSGALALVGFVIGRWARRP